MLCIAIDAMEQRYFLIDSDGRGSASSHVYDKEDGGHGQKGKWCKSLCGKRTANPRDSKALRTHNFDCGSCQKILRNRSGL